MVCAEREQLLGNVEVDETLVGGVEKCGKQGWCPKMYQLT